MTDLSAAYFSHRLIHKSFGFGPKYIVPSSPFGEAAPGRFAKIPLALPYGSLGLAGFGCGRTLEQSVL